MSTAHVLILYLAGNLAAGVAFYGVARTQPVLASAVLDDPLGAFTAWAFAIWQLLRHEDVLVFGHPRSAGKVLAVVAVTIAALMTVTYQFGVVAWLAAGVAGAASVAVLDFMQRLSQSRGTQRESTRVRLRLHSGMRAAGQRLESRPADDDLPEPHHELEPDPNIDDILVKISREGIAALTPEERARLEAARQAMLRRT